MYRSFRFYSKKSDDLTDVPIFCRFEQAEIVSNFLSKNNFNSRGHGITYDLWLVTNKW
jgi:hypothetical protein